MRGLFFVLACAGIVTSGFTYHSSQESRSGCLAPALIRQINVSGVGNVIRGDITDAVQCFKLREPSRNTLAELADTIRRVYQANCMLERLELITFRVSRNTLFVKVQEKRFY
jgi:hypothetical protein